MQPPKIKSILEATTNITIALAITAILCLFAWNYFVKNNVPLLKSGLQKSEIVKGLNQINFKKSKQTLLIALSTGCHFCVKSIPFYRTLLTKQQFAFNNQTQIIIIFPNSESEIQQFIEQNNLPVTGHSTNFQSLNVSTTPTLVLTDDNGKILNFWIGNLQDAEERQIITTVFSESN